MGGKLLAPLLHSRAGRHAAAVDRGQRLRIQDRRIRLLEDDAHRQVVNSLHTVDIRDRRACRALCRRIENAADVPLDRLGVEVRAVVELDTRAKRERERRGIDDLVLLGERQLRVRDEVIDRQQRVVHRRQKDRVATGERDGGIERACLQRGANLELAAELAGLELGDLPLRRGEGRGLRLRGGL
jgi:hypothetical protein